MKHFLKLMSVRLLHICLLALSAISFAACAPMEKSEVSNDFSKDSLDLKNEALKREIDSIKEAHFYDNWLTEEAISYIRRVTDSVLLKYINDNEIKNVELLGVFYGGLSPLNESFIITQNNVFLFTIDRLEKDARVNPPLVFETPPGLLEKVINFKEHKFDDFKKIKVMGIADAELLMLASTNDAMEIEDKAFNICADNPEVEEIISEIRVLKQKESRGKLPE